MKKVAQDFFYTAVVSGMIIILISCIHHIFFLDRYTVNNVNVHSDNLEELLIQLEDNSSPYPYGELVMQLQRRIFTIKRIKGKLVLLSKQLNNVDKTVDSDCLGGTAKMRKYFSLILAIIIFIIIHEGTHALIASIIKEYEAFQVHCYGFEVIYKTPVADRIGAEWGYISGLSNVLTLIIGYILFIYRKNLSRIKNPFFCFLGYWAIFVFMLFDAFNLSIIPFFFGGDIGGIVRGFGINRFLVQSFFFAILLVNRELIIHYLFPLYSIKTKHILFQPIINPRRPI